MRAVDVLDAALAAAERRLANASEWRDNPCIREGFVRTLAALDVRVEPGVETARIRHTGRKAVVEIGPGFARRYLHTPADALHVVAHEVLHHIRGDLLRPRARSRVGRDMYNLALDVFVNACLERIWFGGEGAPYQRALYDAGAFPGLLLLPPRQLLREVGGPASDGFLARGEEPFNRNWSGSRANNEEQEGARVELGEALTPHLSVLGVPAPGRVADLYAMAWLDLTGFDAFWSSLWKLLLAYAEQRAGAAPWNLPPLVGGHDVLKQFDALARMLGFADYVKSKLAGRSAELREDEVGHARRPLPPGPLAAVVARALDLDWNDPTRRLRRVDRRTVLPGSGRRDVFALTCGATPTFWSGQVWREIPDPMRVHLYLDVSGSMDALLPVVYALVSTLGDLLGRTLHLFSNKVVDVSLQDLRRGRRATTYGTDFDCVVRHALEHGYARIVVLTDGCAGLEARNAASARAAGLGIYVVLLGADARWPDDLAPIAREVWRADVGSGRDLPW